MKKVNFLFIGLLLSSQSVLATESMSCPAVSDINNSVAGYNSNDGKWFGQLMGNENMGNIKAFKEAIYVSEKDGTAFGLLSKCTYSLDIGSVDIRFTDEREKKNKGLYVSLPLNSSWEEGGYFYVCTSSNIADCSFNRLTDEEINTYRDRVETTDESNLNK